MANKKPTVMFSFSTVMFALIKAFLAMNEQAHFLVSEIKRTVDEDNLVGATDMSYEERLAILSDVRHKVSHLHHTIADMEQILDQYNGGVVAMFGKMDISIGVGSKDSFVIPHEEGEDNLDESVQITELIERLGFEKFMALVADVVSNAPEMADVTVSEAVIGNAEQAQQALDELAKILRQGDAIGPSEDIIRLV